MKPRRKRFWLYSATAVLLMGVLMARAFHRKPELRVTTAAVTTGAIVRRVVATGALQATSTVQVGAQVSGTIQSLGADFNSVVHAGQTLARLDPSLFEAALGQARASVQQAEASLTQAEANGHGFEVAVVDTRTKMQRAESLAGEALIPQSDLDAAHIAYDQAMADLEAGTSQVKEAQAMLKEARAEFDQGKVNLDHTVIASPIDGVVVARSVEVGQTVASAIQAPVLFAIATDLKRMQVEVDVDESDVAGIERGEPVTFQVESYPDETFTGTVSNVRLQPVAEQTTTATPVGAAAAQPAGTTPTVIAYATMIDVLNTRDQLRPGMTAIVTLDGARRDHVTRVPNGALSFRPTADMVDAIGQSMPVATADISAPDSIRGEVWRFDGNRFVPLPVVLGLSDNQWTEMVKGGIRPDDMVVTTARLVRR
jgi:HlyD family secretion protein